MKRNQPARYSCRARTFFIFVFLTILLRSQNVCAYAANTQEDESSDYGGSESNAADKIGQNEEIYTPELLQQEIEAMERRIEANLQTVSQDSNQQTSDELMKEKSKQYFPNSAEYYDDDSQIPQPKQSKGTDRPKPKLDHPLDRSEMSMDNRRNEANLSATEYDENTEEVRDKLKEEILKSIQQEIESRKSRKNEPTDGAAIIKHFLEKRPQLLPKKQKSRNFNDLSEKPAAQPNKNQHNQFDYYDDELPEKGDKPTNQQKADQLGNDFMHARRKTSTDAAITKATFKKNDADMKKNNLPEESLRTESTHSTTMTTPVPSTLMTTSMSATSAPELLYGTSLPTPLALGNMTTTSTIATNLSTTSTLQPLDMLAPTTVSKTETAPTTLRPGGKQGKQINILRRKLQPHEKLRNYIEDAYIRMPLAVIVDPSAESLEKTKALWRDALRTNLNIKIVLVSLNASGAPAAYSFNSTRQFLAGLNSLKEQSGGDAFIGVVHASELVPYDSAVFISTSTLPPHTELIQDAAITLLKKRIRLYLLWFGERILSENETHDSIGGILGEVAIRSGGDILHIVGGESSQELDGGNHMILIADTFRSSQDIDIPVDTTLSSLHVKIDAPTRAVTLETPYGDLNLKKLIKFKSYILPKEHLDAYVPLTKIRKTTIFKLKIVPENDSDYFVFVRADRKADNFLEDMIKRFESYFMEGVPYYPISVQDGYTKNIATHENLKFPEDTANSNRIDTEDKRIDPKDQVETFSEMEIKNNTQENAKTNSTADAVGARTTFENQQLAQGRNLLQTSVTRIEMSIQSQLNVEPGQMAQLLFEVTNTRSEPVFHNIQVVDERRYLARLVPQSIFLRAGETGTVAVTVLVPPNTPQGTIDRITFTCQGSGTASLSVNLKVNSALNAQDNNAPTISWIFGSRCEYVNADSATCAERFWTIDITAQDWESGILRLQTTPTNRLIYRNAYTVGSTEPLRATYAATCCEPKVTLLAFDVANNQRSYNIDVRDLYLTEAAIAAIVLGCLLLLLLIALLIWAIVICCRRRKIVLDLPTYRSHSTRSME